MASNGTDAPPGGRIGRALAAETLVVLDRNRFMLVAVVVGYLVIPIGEARISQASCDKIQPGWTAAQVHEFLGSRRNPLDTMYLEVWGDEDGWIVVRFDPQEERVIETGFIPTDSSTYERMKRRIERRIRALWP